MFLKYLFSIINQYNKRNNRYNRTNKFINSATIFCIKFAFSWKEIESSYDCLLNQLPSAIVMRTFQFTKNDRYEISEWEVVQCGPARASIPGPMHGIRLWHDRWVTHSVLVIRQCKINKTEMGVFPISASDSASQWSFVYYNGIVGNTILFFSPAGGA